MKWLHPITQALRHFWGRRQASPDYDDSLDAFGIHGVGGTTGALLTDVFAASW